MVSLQNFPNLPKHGEVSICEKDGRICSLPINEINVSQISTTLKNYPEINISRELFSSNASILHHDDRRNLLIPVNDETLIKRVTRTFFEEDIYSALQEATDPINSINHPIISSIAKYSLYIINAGKKIKWFLRPNLKEQGPSGSIAWYSETRDWQRSSIRCIKWHPNCFKIAVAASDDSIRVYTNETTMVPILKSGNQKMITSMAWRPWSPGQLAVGCKTGTLIWSLDPNSHITRPLSQATHLKHENHFPVTAVEWSPDGLFLATASISDTDVLIWDVDQNRNTPLKRVGFSCSMLKWSPDGYRLCSTTVEKVFRVWTTTNQWTPERWTIGHGTVQSVVWSPCSFYILFVTSEEPYLYSLRFVEEQLFTASSLPKQALPVADLSKKIIDQTEVGGRPQLLSWSPQGNYLGVTFKDTNAIAIFHTVINKHLLSISPLCFLTGIGIEYPAYICFQEKYKENNTEVLTIGWSGGRVQYFPFI